MKTANEMKNQAMKLNLRSWKLRSCSICGYEIGYVFKGKKDWDVRFDSGCHCVSYCPATRESSWEEVAKVYDFDKTESQQKEMEKVWKFYE